MVFTITKVIFFGTQFVENTVGRIYGLVEEVTETEILILLGCILLFLIPTILFFYKKPKLTVQVKKLKKQKTHSYIYAIKHESYDWDVYKLGKTTQSPRNRMWAYETSHQSPPYYVLLYKINTKSKLAKAENSLKSFFISSGRLADKERARKEMYRFDSIGELYFEVNKVLKENKIGFVELLHSKEYSSSGHDLKPRNSL
jgi:hypothetical protein